MLFVEIFLAAHFLPGGIGANNKAERPFWLFWFRRWRHIFSVCGAVLLRDSRYIARYRAELSPGRA